MKLHTDIETLINEQIAFEQASAQAYLAMAAWFESTPYQGFAKWMHKQSGEEHAHAMKFFRYLCSRGNTVQLTSIPEPKASYASPLEAFKASLEQEQNVTRSIHKIYEAALSHKDYETTHFLGWFLEEQIEEEETAQSMIEQLELAGEHVNALMRLDAHAGRRE